MHAFCVCFFILCAAEACIFLFVCLSARFPYKARKSRFLIVCGARVWPDRTPSKALRFRLEKALWAYRSGLCETVIVTGGQGSDEPCPEALVMKKWLLENDVPESRVFTDEASVNTLENLKNAKSIMQMHAGGAAILVTSDYHLSRTLFLARLTGIKASGLPAASVTRPVKWLQGRFRETVSWQLLFFRLLLGRINF